MLDYAFAALCLTLSLFIIIIVGESLIWTKWRKNKNKAAIDKEKEQNREKKYAPINDSKTAPSEPIFIHLMNLWFSFYFSTRCVRSLIAQHLAVRIFFSFFFVLFLVPVYRYAHHSTLISKIKKKNIKTLKTIFHALCVPVCCLIALFSIITRIKCNQKSFFVCFIRSLEIHNIFDYNILSKCEC